MANQFRVRRGLIVNGSGSALLDIQGSQGQLFSVTDQLSGSLFSVSDASGIPVLEAFSDTSVRLGLYGAEAIIVSGSNARITGSLLGTASFALSASWAPGGGGGGGSLTGGAADYVAVWNSTTTLTTRSLYDNGNVGIGTTSPTALLNISSSTAASVLRVDTAGGAAALFVSGSEFVGIGTTSTSFNTLNRRVVAINGTSTALIGLMTGGTNRGYFFHDATDAYLYNIANGAMIFGTNNAERMRITSGGNVGIGTTAPAFPLDIVGDIRSSGNIRSSNGTITTAISWQTGPTYGIVGTFSNHDLSIWTNNSQKMLVTAAGNVGIGTSTPTTLLHVSGTTGGVFEVDGAGAAGVNAFYVSSSGNVGIGTTNTTFRLFVTGSTNTVNFKGSGSAVFSVDGTSGRLFQVDDSLTGSLFSVNTAAGLPLIEAFSNNTVLIGQYGQNTLYVSQSRVGIGTTIPASRLHVSGTTGGAFQVNGAAATLAFYVSASGRVGIGTTTLLNTFHVVGSGRFTDSLAVSTAVSTGDAFIELGTGRSASGFAYIDLVGDTTYTDYGLRIIRGSAGANATSEIIHRGIGVLSISTQDAASLVLSTLNTARLTILSGGNVGIGSTSPIYNLDVVGALRSTGNTFLATGGTNVGIGTTAVSARLQVNGNTAIGYSGATTAPTNGLQVSGSIAVNTTLASWASTFRVLQIGVRTALFNSDINFTGLYNNIYYDGAAYRYLATAAASSIELGNGVITFGTVASGTALATATGVERMRINNDGNIGIGTSTASSLLHVSGTTGGVFRVNGAAAVNALFVSASGNVGIGTTSPSAKLTIQNDGTTVYSNAVLSNTNSTASLALGVGGSSVGVAGLQNNAYLINSGNSALVLGTNDTERMRITSGGDVGIGTTSPSAKLQVDGNVNIIANSTPTVTVPNGTAGVINTGGSTIINYYGSVTSPYTQNIQIDIVYSNWGGNNTVSLVDLMASLREWSNTPGVAFGKIFASQTGASTTFSTFNTTNITTSQCAVTAASGGNYTLRITINPDNNTDVYSLSLNIHTGGTGTAVSSVTISLV
jgi:hypothetical protein